MQTIYKTRPGRRIRKIVDSLGPTYRIRKIDGEWCGYRSLGALHDLEISGLDVPAYRLKFHATVYVWQLNPRIRTIEQHTAKTLEELEGLLQELENRFAA